jgi:hypothetical protein
MLNAKHCVFGAAFSYFVKKGRAAFSYFVKKGRFWCSFLLFFKKGERVVFGGAFSYSLKKGRFWYCFLLIFKKGKKRLFLVPLFLKKGLYKIVF